MLIGTVVLVASLTYLPALALGPIVEQITMIADHGHLLRAHLYAFFTSPASLLSCRLFRLVYPSRCPDPLLENTRMDFVYIVGIVVFCGLCLALAAGCEKLRSRAPGGRP
jgi:Potassium-transporting ATPase A subunit